MTGLQINHPEQSEQAANPGSRHTARTTLLPPLAAKHMLD